MDYTIKYGCNDLCYFPFLLKFMNQGNTERDIQMHRKINSLHLNFCSIQINKSLWKITPFEYAVKTGHQYPLFVVKGAKHNRSIATIELRKHPSHVFT